MIKDLIYDVGLHKGEDTDYYLKKGYRVIAFEANPELIELCKVRFEKEIKQKRLIIIEGAISDTSDDFVEFYKNDSITEWGTIMPAWKERNLNYGHPSSVLQVEKIDFKQCIEKYGMPYYMKIDIEGMDMYCLESILSFKERPAYISIETELKSYFSLKKEFELFEELGYHNFNIVDQIKIRDQREPEDSKEGPNLSYTFSFGATGLFGTDLRSTWHNKKKTLINHLPIFFILKILRIHTPFEKSYFMIKLRNLFKRILGLRYNSWFDTHAVHKSHLNIHNQSID